MRRILPQLIYFAEHEWIAPGRPDGCRAKVESAPSHFIASSRIHGWSLTFKNVRSMANGIISRCVASNIHGDYMTYGMRATMDHFSSDSTIHPPWHAPGALLQIIAVMFDSALNPSRYLIE